MNEDLREQSNSKTENRHEESDGDSCDNARPQYIEVDEIKVDKFHKFRKSMEPSGNFAISDIKSQGKAVCENDFDLGDG